MALDFTVFDQVFKSVDSAGQSMAMNFAQGQGLTYSLEIAAVAASLEMLVVLIIMISDTGKAALIRFSESSIPAIVIAGLIWNWGTMVVPAPIKISDELVTIASGGQAPAGLGNMIAEKFAPTIRVMSSSLFPSQQPVSTPSPAGAAPAPAPAKSKSLWDAFVGLWDGAPVSSLLVGIADGLAGSAMTLIDVALVIGAFAICWMSVLAANVLIYIGLCFGPIILALSIISKLRSLMTNWISFMVGAIFFKPVLACLISLCLLMLDKINAIAQTTPSDQLPLTAIMIFNGMLCLSMITLLMNAKSITQSLFGGLAAQLTPHPSSVVNITKLSNTSPPTPPKP
ncbi:MAG: type IV secretion system protein [Thiothrix sp.]|uniref:type IV secretion system protein n=1 Tax=Thiothrix sp. TaxID=1032 RepID=UPI002611283F|nr:type IV secretion system protein [Thiothrix sp.]MDD5395487.1 type IV secretion system protein [Thiothrix sp.]